MLKLVKTAIYSRPVGYISPVQNYNKGKEEEFGQRKLYDMERIKEEVRQSIENQ